MRIPSSRLPAGMVLLASALAFPGPGQGQTADYLDYDGLTRELRTLVNGSDLATLRSLGTTLGGREIWMVEVGIPSGASLDLRPGVLVAGNLEGDHLVGSHLAMEALRYLIRNRTEDAVQSVLSSNVFYFFPRLNPDGAEAMFASVKGNRKTNALPWDEDNDGWVDEDGPEDLNGDGYVTVMRVPDPAGLYMIDPGDPRIMKKADATKGEAGSYKLYSEGTDEDGDGFINEDGPGGVDLNRNFQHAYPYWEGDAGPHMVSEIETRAIMDFALAHRNIAAFLTFGETDNLVTPPNSRGELAGAKVLNLPVFATASLEEVFTQGVFTAGGGGGQGRGRGGFGGRGGGGGSWLRGAQPGRDNDPSSGTRPATTVASDDQVYFTAVSTAYKEITGIENVPVHRTPEGALFQYGYFHFGVPSFTTPGWGIPAADSVQGDGDAKILASLEAVEIEAFSDWTAFQHPELGEVEIGGFLPYVTHNPPADRLPELGEKHGQFLVKLAGMLPHVRIAEAEAEAHGGGVFTVTVEVENTGFFPTSTQHGVRSRSVGPTYAQIQVDPDDILTGADKTASVGVLNGSGSREEVTWIIRGQQGAQVEIRLLSEKSGHDTRTVTLR
ncbi:M14 family metallopeptidase [Gemmatimonadota bacterium]